MKRALLVIDVQNEYFTGKLPISYPPHSLENILTAMDTATAQNIPVVVIQHAAPQPNSATFRKGTAEQELQPKLPAAPEAF